MIDTPVHTEEATRPAEPNPWWTRMWFFRTSTAFKVSPVLLVVGIFVSLANSTYAYPYWLDLTSKSTTSLLFLGPGFAALAAWDARRWRSLCADSCRSRVEVLAHAIMPIAVATSLTYLITLAILGVEFTPESGLPNVGLLTVSVFITCAYAVVGYALGTFLPRFYAATVAFASVWLWLAFTPTLQPFWLRNVTGNLGTSCCAIDKALGSNALTAPLLVAAALVGACALIVTAANPWRATVCAGLPLIAIAVASAGYLVRNFGADPVVSRSSAQTCLHREGYRLCAWPEHEATLRDAAPVIASALHQLRAAGLPTPREIHESFAAARSGFSFTLNGGRADDWRASVATSPLAGLPPACVGKSGGHWPAAGAYDPVGTWLLIHAGFSREEAASRMGADGEKSVVALLSEPHARQAAWVQNALTAMHGCGPVNPL